MLPLLNPVDGHSAIKCKLRIFFPPWSSFLKIEYLTVGPHLAEQPEVLVGRHGEDGQVGLHVQPVILLVVLILILVLLLTACDIIDIIMATISIARLKVKRLKWQMGRFFWGAHLPPVASRAASPSS